MKRERFYIKTFGCQMNEHDSERIKGFLISMGYEETNNPADAEILVVNTCTVRAKSEHKAFSLLGRLKKLKERNGRIIGIAGCVAQERKEKLVEWMPYIDFIIGPGAVSKFPEIIRKILNGEKPVICLEETEREERFVVPLHSYSHNWVKAYVSIIEGCNNFCSYCIVPFVRGKEVSRLPKDVIDECKKLAEKGIKEVILLGQNVNSYGKDLGTSLSELLKEINKIEGIKRIRFLTSHPKDLTDEIINCFGDLEKLCEQIHLPAQSGSDKILKFMNRRYTRDDYLKLVEKLRKVREDIAITSDFIVGFPGETEEDFRATLSLLREVRFDNIFSFKYSPRPGTDAQKMEDDVPPAVKTMRILELQELQKKISLEINSFYVGKIEEVLVEGMSRKMLKGKVHCQLTGRNRKNKIVNFEGNPEIIGKFVEVRIIEALANDLIGDIISIT